MKTKIIKGFDKEPPEKFNNEYPTSHGMFRAPWLMLVCGVRNSGKGYLTSKIIRESNAENLYDVIYFITPTFQSNKKQFGDLGVKEENVYEPTRDSIELVIARVEQDRDDWEAYNDQMEIYNNWMKKTRSKKAIHTISDQDIEQFMMAGYLDLDGNVSVNIPKPEWKYKTIRKVQSLLVLDDVMGSPCMNHSAGLTKLATLNRHVAPLSGEEGGSLGLSLIMQVQSYKSVAGISRQVREQCTELILFKNKQEGVMDSIMKELGGVVSEEQFKQAYEYALREKHDSLCISMNPKCPTMQYRRNLTECLVFPEAEKECKCKKKK